MKKQSGTNRLLNLYQRKKSKVVLYIYCNLQCGSIGKITSTVVGLGCPSVMMKDIIFH